MSIATESHVDNFADLLRWRAQAMPDAPAFAFLTDGDEVGARLTFGDLERRARILASGLVERDLEGERIVLLFPTGPEYVVSLFACLLAGAVAVPAYPPGSIPRDRGMERIRALVHDADAAAVLAADAGPDPDSVRRALGRETLQWLTAEPVESEPGSSGPGSYGSASSRLPDIHAGTLALLQYTSGSTAAPKGVAIPHSSLMANCELMRRVFEAEPGDRLVYWVPLYHDYGLIGVVLAGVYGGCECYLMSPLHFLQRPARWLQAISDHRAAYAGAPNFGYELCRRKVTDEQRATLDLSSLKAASTGGEPIRAATLRGFGERFAPNGFRLSMFLPAYGLAENTLVATAVPRGNEPTILAVDPAALAEGRLEPAANGRTLVGCGPAAPTQEVVVVDPETRRRRPDGEVGEIWLRGPSLARGYWRRAEETARTFDARLDEPGDTGGFLRTGDLGALVDGELFVTGRIKDLIILGGRNLYPQDIELTVEGCSDALRPGCSVAFAVEDGKAERLVIAAEVRGAPDEDELRGGIRAAVSREHGVGVHAVELLPAGAVPKTTSGKLRRGAARDAWARGSW